MPVFFDCPTCGHRHPSRVRAPTAEWLHLFMSASGEILERCSETRAWVRILPGSMLWVADGWMGNGSHRLLTGEDPGDTVLQL